MKARALANRLNPLDEARLDVMQAMDAPTVDYADALLHLEAAERRIAKVLKMLRADATR